MAADTGYVWFGTEGGWVCRWNKSTSVSEYFQLLEENERFEIYDLELDKNGHLWVGTDGFGAFEFDGTQWKRYSRSDGLGGDSVYTIAADKNGSIWFGTESGAAKYDGGTWNRFTSDNSGIGPGAVKTITFDLGGSVWLSNFGRLNKFDGSSWKQYAVFGTPFASALDKNGELWFASTHGVLLKFDGYEVIQSSTSRIGFDRWYNNSSLVADAVGGIWLGTKGGGVARYGGSRWRIFPSAPGGLAGSYVLAIAADPDSTAWFGTRGGGLCRKDGSFWRHYNIGDLLIYPRISALAIEQNGTKWIGTSGGGLAKFDDENWFGFTEGNTGRRLPSNYVTSIAIDKSGEKWFGTYRGLCRHNDVTWINLLNEKSIHTIVSNNQDETWIGTENGVYKYDGFNVTHYTKDDGLG